METITLKHDSQADTSEPSQKTANGEDLLSLFNQYSDLISPDSDWLATEDAVIFNEVSVENISTTYHITAQQHATTALFDIAANMLVIAKILQLSTTATENTIMEQMFSDTANDTDLWPKGHCYLTIKLGKKHFTDKFIILQDLKWDLK